MSFKSVEEIVREKVKGLSANYPGLDAPGATLYGDGGILDSIGFVELCVSIDAELSHNGIPRGAFNASISGEKRYFKSVEALIVGIKASATIPKILFTDLDNTLWMGIYGESGDDEWSLNKLPMFDAIGEIYKRGVPIVAVTRNDDTVRNLLSKADIMKFFAHVETNCYDKASVIARIASEFEIDLTSCVFVDDDNMELERASSSLPCIVFKSPIDGDVKLVEQIISTFPATSSPERAEYYRNEMLRRNELIRIGNYSEWIDSLGIRIERRFIEDRDIPRVCELLNRSNRMNLTAARYSEDSLRSHIIQTNAYVFTYRDRFDDAGIVGVLSLNHAGADLRVDDFAVSCRVVGRGVEDAMLSMARAESRLCQKKLLIALNDSGKNSMMKKFLTQSGAEFCVLPS